jgi:hypothetical protein
MGNLSCPECGFAYVRGISDDEKFHRSYHDQMVNGVPARPMKSEKVIWRRNDDRVIVVRPFSPETQRVRARKLAQVANREMHYDFGLYHENESPDERDLSKF